MNSPRIKHEGWLYWLAFCIALGLRFTQLGAAPLTDSEAQFALQAFQIAQGKAVLLAPQPLYILFTSFIFLVTEAANFTARFLPALVGSTLVFVPGYFREKLRPAAALILAFLISFDPGLTALSRQSNGTIFAVTFLLFAWGMWRNERFIHAGIFAGLALLSGPSIWSGILILSLTYIFLRESLTQRISPSKDDLRNTAIAVVAVLLFAGAFFFTKPNGLSAIFNSVTAYLSGWVSPSAFTPNHVLITLFAYEPLGLFLASFAILRGFRIRGMRPIRLTIWFGVALLITVFYRQTSELVWAIVPLLILAADELSRAFDIYYDERVELGVVAGAVMILIVYIWFNISGIALNPYEANNTTTIPLFGAMRTLPIGPRYLIVTGASVILVICLGLVAFGWSPRTARIGTTWAFSLFFITYAIAAAWGSSGLRSPNGVELWKPDQSPAQTDLLLKSVEDISLFSRGHIDSQPVSIMGIDSPALEWALRDHDVQIVSVLNPLDSPPIVITPIRDELGLGSAYRGQDFTWRQSPVWDIVQPPDWVRWLVYRQLPRETETIILWARDDLFPDARENVVP
jgi:hypothetical protein